MCLFAVANSDCLSFALELTVFRVSAVAKMARMNSLQPVRLPFDGFWTDRSVCILQQNSSTLRMNDSAYFSLHQQHCSLVSEIRCVFQNIFLPHFPPFPSSIIVRLLFPIRRYFHLCEQIIVFACSSCVWYLFCCCCRLASTQNAAINYSFADLFHSVSLMCSTASSIALRLCDFVQWTRNEFRLRVDNLAKYDFRRYLSDFVHRVECSDSKFNFDSDK